jgi:hypothetical protein
MCGGQAEAANAFLKTLEEPPASSSLILTSSRPEALLETIVSRLQPVRLRRLSSDAIREGLVRAGRKADDPSVALAVAMADGSLGRAKEMLEGDLGRWRAALLKELGQVDHLSCPCFGLALWALAGTYGQKDLVCSGPLYKSMEVDGARVRLAFDHVGGGLAARDGKPLDSFEIAGSDGKFMPAQAEIDGQTIAVSSDQVAQPVTVRFAWSNTTCPNLMNKEGLPASSFRTGSR